jgi:hypothetical protein
MNHGCRLLGREFIIMFANAMLVMDLYFGAGACGVYLIIALKITHS